MWKEWVKDKWGEPREYECHGNQGNREFRGGKCDQEHWTQKRGREGKGLKF